MRTERFSRSKEHDIVELLRSAHKKEDFPSSRSRTRLSKQVSYSGTESSNLKWDDDTDTSANRISPPADARILKLIVRLAARLQVPSLSLDVDYLSSSLCHGSQCLPSLLPAFSTWSEPTDLSCHYLVHTNHRPAKIYKLQIWIAFHCRVDSGDDQLMFVLQNRNEAIKPGLVFALAIPILDSWFQWIKTCSSGLPDDKLSPEWVIHRPGSLCSLGRSWICKRQSRTRAGRMPRRWWGPGVAAACRLIRGRTWLIMKRGRLRSWNSLVWWGRGVRLFQGMQLWHLITVQISFFQRRLK